MDVECLVFEGTQEDGVTRSMWLAVDGAEAQMSSGLSSCGSNPSHSHGTENDEAILKIGLRMCFQERKKALRQQGDQRRVNLDPDDTRLGGQRKNRPITEMLIQGDEDSVLCAHAFEDFGIVSPGLPGFCRTQHIVSTSSQLIGQLEPFERGHGRVPMPFNATWMSRSQHGVREPRAIRTVTPDKAIACILTPQMLFLDSK
jgi:hypothetical protein